MKGKRNSPQDQHLTTQNRTAFTLKQFSTVPLFYSQMYLSQLCQNTVYGSLDMKQCDSFLHKCTTCIFSLFFLCLQPFQSKPSIQHFHIHCYKSLFFLFFPLITNLFLSSRLDLYRKRNFKTIIKNSVYHAVKKISIW